MSRWPITTPQERFFSKVDKAGPLHPVLGTRCWIWTGAARRQNLPKGGKPGFFNFNKRVQSAHRVAWQLAYGPIPEGMCVCHKCDNPSCVRSGHLFIGTQLDNIRDMVGKGRSWFQCEKAG